MAGHGEFESPVDLPREGAGNRTLGWTTMTIFVASLVLLVTNAFSIKSWADELSASPLQARVASWAAEWEAATGALGLGTPRAVMHGYWKEGQAARFDGAPIKPQR